MTNPAVAKAASLEKHYVKTSDPEIGWMTEAKDWAGELISGQTTTGRILVSYQVHFLFYFHSDFSDLLLRNLPSSFFLSMTY